jgi:hypothetical protein
MPLDMRCFCVAAVLLNFFVASVGHWLCVPEETAMGAFLSVYFLLETKELIRPLDLFFRFESAFILPSRFESSCRFGLHLCCVPKSGALVCCFHSCSVSPRRAASPRVLSSEALF